MKYFDEIKHSMEWLATKPDTLFLGQAVAFPGNVITKTLVDIPSEKKLECPVAEEMQMGMSIGLALNGIVPVTIYPRFDFLLLAMSQLVNHLNRFPDISEGKVVPKVIIRTMVGSVKPLHPGHQHCNDYSTAFGKLLKWVQVVRLDEPEEIFPAYEEAYNALGSTLLVEYGDFYNEK